MSTDLHVTHKLDGLKLGPKLGPFPAVVWVLIIGAGLYVAHRRAKTAAATSSATDTSTATDTTSTSSDVPGGASTDVPLEVIGGGGASGLGDNAGAPVSVDTTPVDIQDNVTWQGAAIRALIKAGVTPITANNAVDRYLSGDMLTAEEAHAVNVALSLVGPPPEGAPPVTLIPAGPVPTPVAPRPSGTTTTPRGPRKPASTRHRTSGGAPRPASRGGRVTVHSGDNLTTIAAAHGVAEPALYDRNRGTIEAAAHAHGRKSSEHGHWIFPGTVLVLP